MNNKNTLRIGFMGTPDFSAPVLKALHENTSHDIVCAYSQPPRPKGRGKKVQSSPVHIYAEQNDIPVFTPTSLKTEDEQTLFKNHNLDVAIVVAYGLILPKPILNAPKYGCINIHASLLPRWRGASPIQQAIWASDRETGVSIMQMDEGLDTGPVISMQSLPITQDTNAATLHDALSDLGAQMIIETVNTLAEKQTLESTPQDDANTIYAPLLKKEDGQINWSQTAQQIDCQIRALNPWPGVRCSYNEKPIKILSAEPVSNTTNAPAGTILNRDGHIACGQNTILKITKIQPHNAKAMDFISAINGGHIDIESTLT